MTQTIFMRLLPHDDKATALAGARPVVVADLGYEVLDTAMVETAAYVLERA